LDEHLKKFLDANVMHIMKIVLHEAVVVDQLPLTRLTPVQADAELTRMIWQLKKPKVMVDALSAKLLAERPSDPQVRALIARIAAHQGDPMSIDDLAESLAKGGVSDPQVRIDVADALVYANKDESANRRALAILGDLVQLEVPPVEAVELWTTAAGRTGGGAAQIIAVLEPLLFRVPHDTAVLRSLARSYETMGDKAKSRDAYNRIILVSHSPEERHWAQLQADSARLQDVPKPVSH
jgi:predicted Zn-dependent protease